MEMLQFLREWKTIMTCSFQGGLFRFRKWLGWRLNDCDAIQSLYDSLDPKSITYSQVWEDPRTLRRALKLGPGDKVICVCSGGDNAFALLLDDPEFVLAVDFSPAQVTLGELKKQAIKTLSYEDFLFLMGIENGYCSSLSRLELYERKLRPGLNEKTTAFWDNHKDAFSHGLIHHGVYEQYFHAFGKAVRPLALSLDTIHMFMKSSKDEQADIYDNEIDTWKWRALCKLYFGDVLVGRCPVFYERSDVNVGIHFLSRLKHVMRNVPVSDNYYLEYVLTGNMTGRFGLPEYMKPENFKRLKKTVDKIAFVEGDILKILEDSEAKFDAIDLSNIFDFVPLATHKRYRKAVIDRAEEGCRVCHWTFVPVCDEKVDWSAYGDECKVNKELSEELNNLERAWFYQTFIVQTVGEPKKLNKPKKNGIAKNGTSQPHRNGTTNGKKVVH